MRVKRPKAGPEPIPDELGLIVDILTELRQIAEKADLRALAMSLDRVLEVAAAERRSE